MYFTKIETKKGIRYACTGEGPRDPLTGKRQQIRRRAKTKKEAKAKVEAIIREIEGRSLADRKRAMSVTFEQLAADWLRVYSTSVKKSTVRIRQKEIKILNRYIPKARIGSITRKMCQDILVDLAEQGYARSTIEGVQVTAEMIFRQAITWQLLNENPTTGVKVPKPVLTVKEMTERNIENKYLDHEEVSDFLSAVEKFGDYNDKIIFYTLLFTGMRAGELSALQWPDIDFDHKLISITKTIYAPNDNMHDYELTPPKTITSVRTFDVIDDVIELLHKHKVRQAKAKLKCEDYHDDHLVIANDQGYPYLQYKIGIRMKKIMEHTKIKKKMTPHKLRHTHISILTELGVDLKTIMDRVGHKDMETTIGVYTHVTNKMKKDTSQKMDQYLKGIRKITL
jgi:integrase